MKQQLNAKPRFSKSEDVPAASSLEQLMETTDAEKAELVEQRDKIKLVFGCCRRLDFLQVLRVL